jgi:hypothetical protein
MSNTTTQHDVPEDLFDIITARRKLFRYVYRGQFDNIYSGRGTTKAVSVIHWPHLLVLPHFLKKIKPVVWPAKQEAHEAKALGFDMRCSGASVEYRAWHDRRLRDIIDTLLGSLVIDATSVTARAAWEAYAQLQLTVDPSQDADALTDPKNYTCFAKTNLDTTSQLRTLVAPPLRHKSPYDDARPPHIIALYAAFLALYQRHHEGHGFDPAEVGLTYAKSGHLVVNWDRFRDSRFWPHTLRKLTGEDLALGVEEERPVVSIKGAIVKRDLKPDLNSTVRTFDKQVSQYVRICIESDIALFDHKTVDWCSIIDPLVFLKKPQYFDGFSYYRSRERKRKQRQERLLRQRANPLDAPAVTARVFPFVFKPFEYHTPELCKEDTTPWYPQAHSERIYAIRRNGELLFTRPILLREAAKIAPWEVEAWKRAIDALKCVERFLDNGDVGNIQAESRSNLFQTARHDFLTRVGRETIKGFVSIDQLGPRAMQRLKQQAARTYLDENPQAVDGTRWYHDGVLQQVKDMQVGDINAVRRVAKVIIPELNKDEPVKAAFYTPAAIKLFKMLAEKNVDACKAYSMDPAIIHALTHQMGPTPYLAAWARFCQDTQNKGVDFAEDDQHAKHWTPDEDLALVLHYHPYPKMTAQEWRTLLTMLPERSQNQCQARIRTINRRFKKVLAEPQWNQYRVGKLCGKLEHAKRAVMLFGFLTNYQGPLHKRLKEVGNVLRIDDGTARHVALPPRYRGTFFLRVAS